MDDYGGDDLVSVVITNTMCVIVVARPLAESCSQYADADADAMKQ